MNEILEVSYDPSIFENVETLEQAQGVILTPDGDLTSVQRWETETAFLVRLLERFVDIRSVVLDFGCGVGRLAKPLIEKRGCEVLGMDESPKMLGLASAYVADYRFTAMPPDMSHLLRSDICDVAIAVWTLQHVFALGLEISRIKRLLEPGGILLVVNNHRRAIPIKGSWFDDGRNVDEALIATGFECIERGKLDNPNLAREWLANNTFWAIYRRK